MVSNTMLCFLMWQTDSRRGQSSNIGCHHRVRSKKLGDLKINDWFLNINVMIVNRKPSERILPAREG